MKGGSHTGISLVIPYLSRSAYTAVFPPTGCSLPKAWPRRARRLWQWTGSWTWQRAAPRFLRQPEIAQLVMAALRDGDRKFHRYQLHAFVVMPNHVHLLVTPSVIATRWLGPLKGLTSYQANELLGTHGRAYWQDKSYDHLVRSDVEFERVRVYIERNPITAGLVTAPERFRWSSASGRDAA